MPTPESQSKATCPFGCGAALQPDCEVTFACLSWKEPAGESNQSWQCKLRCAEQQIATLTAAGEEQSALIELVHERLQEAGGSDERRRFSIVHDLQVDIRNGAANALTYWQDQIALKEAANAELVKELAILKNSGGACGHAGKFFAYGECQVCLADIRGMKIAAEEAELVTATSQLAAAEERGKRMEELMLRFGKAILSCGPPGSDPPADIEKEYDDATNAVVEFATSAALSSLAGKEGE